MSYCWRGLTLSRLSLKRFCVYIFTVLLVQHEPPQLSLCEQFDASVQNGQMSPVRWRSLIKAVNCDTMQKGDYVKTLSYIKISSQVLILNFLRPVLYFLTPCSLPSTFGSLTGMSGKSKNAGIKSAVA